MFNISFSCDISIVLWMMIDANCNHCGRLLSGNDVFEKVKKVAGLNVRFNEHYTNLLDFNRTNRRAFYANFRTKSWSPHPCSLLQCRWIVIEWKRGLRGGWEGYSTYDRNSWEKKNTPTRMEIIWSQIILNVLDQDIYIHILRVIVWK